MPRAPQQARAAIFAEAAAHELAAVRPTAGNLKAAVALLQRAQALALGPVLTPWFQEALSATALANNAARSAAIAYADHVAAHAEANGWDYAAAFSATGTSTVAENAAEEARTARQAEAERLRRAEAAFEQAARRAFTACAAAARRATDTTRETYAQSQAAAQ